jgi:hypothetical protein
MHHDVFVEPLSAMSIIFSGRRFCCKGIKFEHSGYRLVLVEVQKMVILARGQVLTGSLSEPALKN